MGFFGAASAMGYSANTILRQIAKQFPKAAPYISTAYALGYSPQRIINRLSREEKSTKGKKKGRHLK